MKTYLYLASLFIVLSAVIVGCNNEEDDCPDSAVPYMRLGLENTSNASIDSIFMYNDNLADSLYNGNTIPGGVNIPLKLDADTTSIHFDIKYTDSANIVSDEVLIIYQPEFKLNNLECGFITEFNLSMVTSTIYNIDSTTIHHNKVNSEIRNHAKIYF